MPNEDPTTPASGPDAPSPRAARKDLLPAELSDYLDRLVPPAPPAVAALRAATAALPEAFFQMPPTHAALLVVLLRAAGARRFLEIGTFTGLTTLAAALALPPDGRVVTLDVDPRYPAIGQPHWADAGVAARIRLMIGPARRSLATLIEDREVFDMALVDADKEGYPDYYEAALALLRPGGLLLLDNMLWRGRVLDAADEGEKPRLLRRLNRTICSDPRVDASLLPLGDGLMLVHKHP